MGLTVREQGLEVVGQVPTALAEDSPLKELGRVAAVDPSVLRKLPEGAFGVFALSQPGKYYNPITNTVLTGEQRETFENELKEAEEDMGLTVKGDVVPAFGGNVVVAVYPDSVDPSQGVEIVSVVDDANGADPATVANKLREFAQTEMDLHLTSEQISGCTVWAPQQQVAGKTVFAATAGKSVVFASSRPLLEQTLAAFTAETAPATGYLLSQASYAGMQPSLVSGAQMLLMVDLRKILETFRPQLEPAMKGDKDLKYEDVLGLFGSEKSGLVASGKYDGAAGTFQIHLPLDYDRLIHLIAVGTRKANSGEIGMPSQPDQATEGTSIVQ